MPLQTHAFQWSLCGFLGSPERKEFRWTQMPLRTEAMHRTGLSGGDGFQQVYGLSYAPSDPQRVYASIDCAQVWRSDDGGDSWFRTINGFRAIGGMDLSVDPVNKEIVFVAGGQGRSSADGVDGIYRTLNGGLSWERVLPAKFYKLDGPRGGSMFWIDLQSASGGQCQTIFAADQNEAGSGIYRSINGGTTWTNLGVSGFGIIFDFQRNPHRPEFWVSASNGLFIVCENHGNWSASLFNPAGLPSGISNAVSRIQFHSSNSNVIYALCGQAGFYKSADGGTSFSARDNGISNNIAGKKIASMLDVNPLNSDWLVLGHFEAAYGNYMSFDGGETWRGFQNMDSTGMMRDLDTEGKVNSFYVGHKTAFHPQNPEVALIPGYMSEMERTEDGGQSWTFSGNGFCGARVSERRTSFSFPAARPDELTFFCTDYGPFRSDNNGGTFRTLRPIRVDGARSTPVGAVHPLNPNIIVTPVGGWDSQRLCLTTNGGTVWAVTDSEPGNFRFCAFHPQNPATVYAGDRRSDNGGLVWSRLNRPVVEMYPANGSIVYSYETADSSTQFYRSSDCGETWTELGPLLEATSIREVTVDPSDPDRLYVPAGRGLYILNNGTWALLNESSGIPQDWFGDYALWNMAVHPGNTDILYVGRRNSQKGHSDGILCSRDRGLSWTNISGNMGPELTVWAIGVDARHDRVYIGTSHGTWYTDGGAGFILAGWDGAMNTSNATFRTADLAASGISAEVRLSDSGTPGTHWSGSWAGSSDASFGSRTRAGARVSSTVQNGAFFENTSGAYMDFTLKNTGTRAYELTGFRFDVWRTYNGVSSGFRLSLAGNVLSAGSFTVQGANPQPSVSDYEDVDITLNGPALAPGQCLVFRLETTGRTGGGNLFIDNVAVTGRHIRE